MESHAYIVSNEYVQNLDICVSDILAYVSTQCVFKGKENPWPTIQKVLLHNSSLIISLYTSLDHPHIEYAFQVWAYHTN